MSHISYKDFNAEADRHLHRQFIVSVIEIHHVFRDRAEEEGPRRFLTGFLSTEDIEKDIRLAYDGAIDAGFLYDEALAEYALVRHYLGDPPDEISDYLESTFLGDRAWTDYTTAIHAFINGEELNGDLRRSVERHAEIDWFGGYLAYAAGIHDSYETGDMFYERSVKHGVPAFSFLALTCLFIPGLWILFRPAPRPFLQTYRWHPSLVLAISLWSLIFFQFITSIFAFPEWFYSYNIGYLLMQGGPVFVMMLVFAAEPSRFAHVFGLNHFPFKFVVLILGLHGAYFWFNFGMWEIESRISGYDTRDFLSPNLVGADLNGLLTDLVAAAVIAPIFEELMFRGFLFTSLRNRLGPWLAAFISTSIFAGLHF
ncbi:MAG: type II CAAX endopeptidase family protein [Verrucomicrobiota bacterium]